MLVKVHRYSEGVCKRDAEGECDRNCKMKKEENETELTQSVARMAEIRHAYKIFVEKTEERDHL
jgi:hypothetical protein